MIERERRFMPGALSLVMLVAWACKPEPGDAQERGAGTPIPVPPGTAQPPRPPGGAPESCNQLPDPASVPHWERQSTLLMKLATMRGRPERVGSARVEMIARRALEALPLGAFAQPQAVARITLEQPHNGLAAGTYCLTAVYDSSSSTATSRAGSRGWQTFLYSLRDPSARAVAWVPFLYRADPVNDPQGHPRGMSRPYPPVRFEFTLRSQLERAGASGLSARAPVESVAPTTVDPSWLAAAVWFMCGSDGCCSTGVEALRAYR